jgi:hypothetical protein
MRGDETSPRVDELYGIAIAGFHRAVAAAVCGEGHCQGAKAPRLKGSFAEPSTFFTMML